MNINKEHDFKYILVPCGGGAVLKATYNSDGENEFSVDSPCTFENCVSDDKELFNFQFHAQKQAVTSLAYVWGRVSVRNRATSRYLAVDSLTSLDETQISEQSLDIIPANAYLNHSLDTLKLDAILNATMTLLRGH